MSDFPKPHYDLAEIQRKVAGGFFVVTVSAASGAWALGFDQTDIVACIGFIDMGDFYKTMASEKKPGLMQDVYRPIYLGVPIYLKVQLNHVSNAVVISFKKDQSR